MAIDRLNFSSFNDKQIVQLLRAFGTGGLKNSEVETLSNKTLTAPVLNSATGTFTGTSSGDVDTDNYVINSKNVGAAGTGTVATEYGDGVKHSTLLTVAGVLPAITGDTAQGTGLLLYTFPATGTIVIHAATMSLSIQETESKINTDTPEVGLGTVIATGAVTGLDTPATFENVLLGTAAGDCDGTATVYAAIPTAAVPLVLAKGANLLHFNVADAFDAAAGGEAAAIVAGTVLIDWSVHVY